MFNLLNLSQFVNSCQFPIFSQFLNFSQFINFSVSLFNCLERARRGEPRGALPAQTAPGLKAQIVPWSPLERAWCFCASQLSLAQKGTLGVVQSWANRTFEAPISLLLPYTMAWKCLLNLQFSFAFVSHFDFYVFRRFLRFPTLVAPKGTHKSGPELVISDFWSSKIGSLPFFRVFHDCRRFVLIFSVVFY